MPKVDPTNLLAPRIHLNGTSRQELFDGYLTALEGVRTAIEVAQKTAPNGRDYYVIGPDAIRTAQAQHADRLEQLLKVQEAFEALALAVQGDN